MAKSASHETNETIQSGGSLEEPNRGQQMNKQQLVKFSADKCKIMHIYRNMLIMLICSDNMVCY